MKTNLVSFALLIQLLAQPMLAKDHQINPADYALTATITAVEEVSATTGARITERAPAFCSDPQPGFQTGYCRHVRRSARVTNEKTTYYALTARIGDKIYELHSGMRFGVGEFRAKVTKFGIELLTTDAKGRLVAVSTGIAKESLASGK